MAPRTRSKGPALVATEIAAGSNRTRDAVSNTKSRSTTASTRATNTRKQPLSSSTTKTIQSSKKNNNNTGTKNDKFAKHCNLKDDHFSNDENSIEGEENDDDDDDDDDIFQFASRKRRPKTGLSSAKTTSIAKPSRQRMSTDSTCFDTSDEEDDNEDHYNNRTKHKRSTMYNSDSNSDDDNDDDDIPFERRQDAKTSTSTRNKRQNLKSRWNKRSNDDYDKDDIDNDKIENSKKKPSSKSFVDMLDDSSDDDDSTGSKNKPCKALTSSKNNNNNSLIMDSTFDDSDIEILDDNDDDNDGTLQKLRAAKQRLQHAQQQALKTAPSFGPADDEDIIECLSTSSEQKEQAKDTNSISMDSISPQLKIGSRSAANIESTSARGDSSSSSNNKSRNDQATNQGEPIVLKLRCSDKSEVSINTYTGNVLQNVLDNFVEKHSSKIPSNHNVVLHFDGEALVLTNKPTSYDMEHGDLIDVTYKAYTKEQIQQQRKNKRQKNPNTSSALNVAVQARTTFPSSATAASAQKRQRDDAASTTSSTTATKFSRFAVTLHTRIHHCRPFSSIKSKNNNNVVSTRTWEIRKTDKFEKLVNTYRCEKSLGIDTEIVLTYSSSDDNNNNTSRVDGDGDICMILDSDDEDDGQAQTPPKDMVVNLSKDTPLLLQLKDYTTLDMYVFKRGNATSTTNKDTATATGTSTSVDDDIICLDDDDEDEIKIASTGGTSTSNNNNINSKQIILILRINGNDTTRQSYNIKPSDKFEILKHDFMSKNKKYKKIILQLDGEILNLNSTCDNEDLEGGELIDVIAL